MSMPIVPVRWTLPDKGMASPVAMRRSVDLPDPLRPTRPIRSVPTAKVRSWKSAWPSGVAAERCEKVRKLDIGTVTDGEGRADGADLPVVHGLGSFVVGGI